MQKQRSFSFYSHRVNNGFCNVPVQNFRRLSANSGVFVIPLFLLLNFRYCIITVKNKKNRYSAKQNLIISVKIGLLPFLVLSPLLLLWSPTWTNPDVALYQCLTILISKSTFFGKHLSLDLTFICPTCAVVRDFLPRRAEEFPPALAIRFIGFRRFTVYWAFCTLAVSWLIFKITELTSCARNNETICITNCE